VRQVFAELGQEHLIPLSASGLATLSPAFATSHNEYLWQRRRWPEWEGREWDSNGDPTLAEAVAVIVVQLERRGLLAVTRASCAAAALADLCGAAAALDANGLAPLVSARFATALKALAPAAGEADPAEMAVRWLGVARTAGLAGTSAAAAFDKAMAVAARMGITRAIDRGWNRGQGGGSEAVALLRAALLKAPGRIVTAAECQPGVKCAPAPIAAPAATAAKAGRKSRAAPQKTPDDLMSEGIRLLAEGRAGTHVWFGGLAKVLAAAGAAVPPLEPGFVGMPADSRAPFTWLHIAGKQNLEPDLSRAVAMAREILDPGAPGPAMSL
jgi:hypothetical protein